MAAETYDICEGLSIIDNNSLLSIINWLTVGGNDVVLHANFRGARWFIGNPDAKLELKRTVYVDVAKLPGLLDDGEWESYIKKAGFVECTSTNFPKENVVCIKI